MQPTVPDTLDEMLSPAWLTAALGLRFPGIEVVAIHDVNVMARVATNVLFRIECAGEVPDGLSANLCAKGYFGEMGRLARPASEPETRFYRDLAPSSGVRTLTPVYAEFDPRTAHGVLITEDAAVQGGVFLDALSPYSLDQVAASLEQFATLHAATWSDPSLASLQWLASRLELYRRPQSIEQMQANFDGPIGARIPERVRNTQRLVDAHLRWDDEVKNASPWCVVHGDAHVGNVFLDPSGAPSLLDWQLVQRGPWYLDVGYHIASALPIAERRRAEQDLVRHYLDRLAANGVDPPGWDESWSAVRHGLVHGFFLWGITQKVRPEITATVLERLGTAVDDHGSLDA